MCKTYAHREGPSRHRGARRWCLWCGDTTNDRDWYCGIPCIEDAIADAKARGDRQSSLYDARKRYRDRAEGART